MTRYPRSVRDAAIKCISCNAPVTRTIDDEYVCVECGNTPVSPRTSQAEATADGD